MKNAIKINKNCLQINSSKKFKCKIINKCIHKFKVRAQYVCWILKIKRKYVKLHADTFFTQNASIIGVKILLIVQYADKICSMVVEKEKDKLSLLHYETETKIKQTNYHLLNILLLFKFINFFLLRF